MPAPLFRRLLTLFLLPASALAQPPASAPGTTAVTRPVSYPVLVERPLYARIDAAIDRGVAFLLSRQAPDGTWSEGPDMDSGQTALVTLALMSCGQSPQSPALKRAIDRLVDTHMTHTYAIALRAAVLAQLPPERRYRNVLRTDTLWLTRINRGARNPNAGMYSYGGPTTPEDSSCDLSNSQYGVLGVWYAAEANMEVPSSYWSTVESGWLRAQQPDGGFSYQPQPSASYGSMTTAGLTTLYLARDYLFTEDPLRVRDTERSRGNRGGAATTTQTSPHPPFQPRDVDLAIAAAENWLGDHFSATQNPGLGGDMSARRSLHYLYFGYERAGEASGLTRFGEHRWYDEVATALLARQDKDGAFPDIFSPTIDTAYGLLTLSRGRSPVVLQKYVIDQHTDNRPRDANAVIRWLRRQTERHLNWQRVGPESALPELRESPFLYLASDRAVDLPEAAREKLRTYLDEGGLLLAVQEGKPAEPGAPAADDFTKSIESLADRLYPQYAFRELPRTHPILAGNFPTTKLKTPVLALSNGVRELIVLVPAGDLPWEWMSTQGGAPYNDPAYALVGNILLYLTEHTGPPEKGQTHWVDHNDAVVDTTTLRVARLRFPGNWDPEPAGWVRLANVLNNRDRINLLALPVTPDSRQLLPRDFPLAHLTSTHAFTLPDALRNGLRTYLDQRGLLLFDAAGGDPGAARSFRELMTGLYPKGVFRPLPSDDPIYANLPPNLYRPTAPSRKTSPKSPGLEGFYLGDQLLALYSPDDLSGALVANPTEGIPGYTPPAAAALVKNILTYAAARGPR